MGSGIYQGTSRNINIENGHENNVLAALAREYKTILEIDLCERRITPFKLAGESKEEFGKIIASEDFDQITSFFVKYGVSEEDRARMSEQLTIDFVRDELSRSDFFSTIYRDMHDRYLELKIIRDDDNVGQPKYALMGFADRDADIRKYREEEHFRTINSDMIKGFASEYNTTYYLDLESERATVVSLGEFTRTHLGREIAVNDEFDFEELYEQLIDRTVVDSDKAMMINAGKLDNIRQTLADCKAFTMVFQGNYDDRVRFCIMRVVKKEEADEKPTRVMIGFSERDTEIGLQFVAQQYVNDYTTIAFCNLIEDRVRYYRVHYASRKQFDQKSYSQDFMAFSKVVSPEFRKLWEQLSDPEYLMQILTDTDHRSFIFKRPDIEKPWSQVDYHVVIRNEDNVPETVAISFSRLDDYQAEKIELSERIRKQNIELEEAVRKANAANEAKTRFLANMSHDLRTPLNAVIGFAERARQNPEEAGKYLDQVIVSGQQLLDIINSVLDLSKIENQQETLKEVLTDTKEFYDSLLTVFTEEIRKKNIDLQFTNETEHRFLYIERSLKEKIILNIVSNAVKYTPANGQIEVGFKELPTDDPEVVRVRTTVRDNGIGMSEEFQKNLFKTFEREHTSTVSGIQGTGLGLALVKRLVDMMKGSIDITSRQGEGTCVVIEIPHRIGQDPNAAYCSTEAADGQFLKGRRFLMAEDIDVNAMLTESILAEQGAEVERARDGVECVNMINRAEAGYYDMILMDIQMPNMNGYEATVQIRSIDDPAKAAIPIVAVSANAFKEDRDMAIQSGMNAHIGKPLDVTVMFETIRRNL